METVQYQAKKNQQFVAVFPLWDSTDTKVTVTGQLASDTMDAYYQDDSAPGTWTSFTPANQDTAVEIGSKGVYALILTAAEMNHDRIMLRIAGTGSAQTVVVIETSVAALADIGTPFATDGGNATLFGVLAKMLDDNGGASFDAGLHSMMSLYGAFAQDQYWADVDLSINDDDDTDLWTVTWKKNAAHVPHASVSNPKISVYSREDGSALINDKSLSAVATLGVYSYDATSTERVDSGQHYIAQLSAAIDGATRTWWIIKER